MTFFKKLSKFLKDASQDERIPSRDKKVIVALIALIASPIDLIPDWIPIIGVVDDLVLLALILDYFFEHLDEEVLLSHYPFSLRSFLRVKKTSRLISQFTPNTLKRMIWQYQPSVYK